MVLGIIFHGSKFIDARSSLSFSKMRYVFEGTFAAPDATDLLAVHGRQNIHLSAATLDLSNIQSASRWYYLNVPSFKKK